MSWAPLRQCRLRETYTSVFDEEPHPRRVSDRIYSQGRNARLGMRWPRTQRLSYRRGRPRCQPRVRHRIGSRWLDRLDRIEMETSWASNDLNSDGPCPLTFADVRPMSTELVLRESPC
jgi:hypothetical protein